MSKKAFIVVLVFSSACTTGPGNIKDSAPVHIPVNVMTVPDAVPKYEKRTRAGNPGVYEVFGKRYQVLSTSKGYQQRGIASWYGTKFHGRKTSNGEVYNMYAMTAAHKTLPIPSYVRVSNLKNQRSVVVRINDRGPFHQDRLIDLSYTAAVQLDIQKTGTGWVEVTALQPPLQKVSKNQGQDLNRTKENAVYLQVGAFNNEFNAKQLQQQLLTKQNAQARIQQMLTDAGELYKVQVGPFNSVLQADEFTKQLSLMGLNKTQIVTELK